MSSGRLSQDFLQCSEPRSERHPVLVLFQTKRCRTLDAAKRRLVLGVRSIVDENRIRLVTGRLMMRIPSRENARGRASTCRWDRRGDSELGCAEVLLASGRGGAG